MNVTLGLIVKTLAWLLLIVSVALDIFSEMSMIQGIDNDLSFVAALLIIVWLDLQDVKGRLKQWNS